MLTDSDTQLFYDRLCDIVVRLEEIQNTGVIGLSNIEKAIDGLTRAINGLDTPDMGAFEFLAREIRAAAQTIATGFNQHPDD